MDEALVVVKQMLDILRVEEWSWDGASDPYCRECCYSFQYGHGSTCKIGAAVTAGRSFLAAHGADPGPVTLEQIYCHFGAWPEGGA